MMEEAASSGESAARPPGAFQVEPTPRTCPKSPFFAVGYDTIIKAGLLYSDCTRPHFGSAVLNTYI